MTTFVRMVLLGLVAVILAACSGAAPTASVVDPAARASFVITDVRVDTSKLGDTTSGRQVPSASVNALLQQQADLQLKGQGTGQRRVRAVLSLDSVNIITAGQSFLVGGESLMKGTVALQDVRSGATILSPTELASGGGGWTSGGLVAVATRDDAATELRQMSSEFAARSRILLLGNPGLPSVATSQPAATPVPSETTVTQTPVVLSPAEQAAAEAEQAEEVRCIQTIRYCPN